MRLALIARSWSQSRSASAAATSPPPLFRDIARRRQARFSPCQRCQRQVPLIPQIMGPGVASVRLRQRWRSRHLSGPGQYARQPQDRCARPPSDSKPRQRLFRNMLSETRKIAIRRRHRQGRRGAHRVRHGRGDRRLRQRRFLDLYVTNFGPNVLYHNNGDGTFTNVTRESECDDPRWTTSAAFLDFDGDG